MSRYKFQLDPPEGDKLGSAIRWFLASSETRALQLATQYVRTTAFPRQTRISLLAVEAAG
jgi:hypothetical protein